MSGNNDESARSQVKVDDLSFYSSTPSTSYSLAKKEPGLVQENVKVLREGVMEGISLVRQAREAVTHVVDTGIAHSTGAYNQLTEEENLPARVGVITGAGLLGLAVGALRGRLVKRVMYTMAGAGGGAAVCYPEQAREGGDMVYQEGRKNIMIAYNMVAGVEGGPTPSLPSLTDISNKVTSTDMSLIAASMSRVLYAVARKLKDVYQLGQQQAVVMMDMMSNDEKKADNTAVDNYAAPEIAVATNVEVTKED